MLNVPLKLHQRSDSNAYNNMFSLAVFVCVCGGGGEGGGGKGGRGEN